MEWLKLARDTQVPLDEAVLDVAVGFILVLAVLILMIIIFWAFGKVMVATAGKEKQPKVKAEKPVKPAKAAKASVPAPVPAPVVGDGVDDEIVAVIAAAVAAMAPAGCTYAVRRVERARAARPVWAAAGVMENTRPF